MSIALLPLVLVVVAADCPLPPSATQLPDFMEATDGPIEVLTTAAGAPVDVRDTTVLNSKMANSEFFMDEMQSVVRTRIPERVVHAAGTGAFGYFEVTQDITHLCKAKFFSEVGKKTPVAMRLSLTDPGRGAADTTQGLRGCGFKFYTEEGNFDLIGFNVPVAPIKDPVKAIPVITTRKGNPATNAPDPNMTWDFLIHNPEAIMLTMYMFSDYGAPRSLKDMTCHPCHTYQVCNKRGDCSYMRFHLIPCEGAKFLNGTEARKIAAGDPFYYTKGLYNDIANGEYPCYDLKAQILSDEDRKNADMDIFDVTKILDEIKYPLTTIGKVIMNKNCQNQFEEIETMAFSPGNLVPGIPGAPGKLFESRRWVYRDAQMYRLGSNFKEIPVNCPIQSSVHNYIRDGVPPYNRYRRNGPNYYPNSFKGPAATVEKNRPQLLEIHEEPANNLKQAGYLYSKILTPAQRTTLINNIVENISTCTESIKKKSIKILKIIHPDFGKRVAQGLAAYDCEC